jgi:hypothetical protein
MSAAGLAELRSNLLDPGAIDRSSFRAVRWEVGGFRDAEEQRVLEQMRLDIGKGWLEMPRELRAKVLEYVARGPDGVGRRIWNATKGAAIGVGALGAVAGAVYLLSPSIVMYLVAQHMLMQGAPIAAVGGASFGMLWDN